MKTKGKVERSFSCIRQDFFLGRRFRVIAEHPVLEGRKQYRIHRRFRTGGRGTRRRTGVAAGIAIGRLGDPVPLRSLAVYQAIGSQLATGGRP